MFKNFIKILMLSFLFALVFDTSSCLADNNVYSEITNDEKLIQVLDSLNQTVLGQKTRNIIMGDNLSKRPIRILFINISDVSPECSNDEALVCKDHSGNLYILISNEHRNAPVEALNAILSHEVIHQDAVSSKAEELQGWLNETQEWIALKKLNPELNYIPENKYPLVDRLNAIEKMYTSAGDSTKYIYQEIYYNPAYSDLALYSPGYTSIPADSYISDNTSKLYISHSIKRN